MASGSLPAYDLTRRMMPGKVRKMIMRIWRTQIDEARVAEYEQFAAEESLPMFRGQRGFEGLLFGRRGGDCVVITLWEDDAAADALEVSPRYQDTVARITATGFLVGRSQVERFHLHSDARPSSASFSWPGTLP